MITDKLATFADDTALNTGAAGDYVIGDQIDLGANYQLWDVDELYFVVGADHRDQRRLCYPCAQPCD